MINRKIFFDAVRTHLFDGSLKQSQVSGLTDLLDVWEASWVGSDPRWLAYALATAHHETDRTMLPIEEYGKGAGRSYGRRLKCNGTPYTDTANLFYGRGYVQLTWYENYERASQELGADFISNPACVMVPAAAALIMFKGMAQGWFTGRKFSTYINERACDYLNARRIINGTDRAELVAGYAHKYQAALTSAGAR